jgi:hypothetical protein
LTHRYKKADKKLERLILIKYGLHPEIPDIVKQYDLRILTNEKHLFKDHLAWSTDAEPLQHVKLQGWTLEQAKSKFLEMFNQLYQETKTVKLDVENKPPKDALHIGY